MQHQVDVLIIGVGGGSGAGKTTLIRRASAQLGERKCAVIYQDNYYIDQSHRFDGDGGAVNFDHPDALELDLLAEHLRALKNGQSVEIPIYDFATHSRQAAVIHQQPKPVIFVDGILIFTHDGIMEVLDHSVFIECEENLRLQRRIARDTIERGRREDGVRRQFRRQVAPMHDRFVEPGKAKADIVLSQEECLADMNARVLLELIR